MVGICGAVGESLDGIDSLNEAIKWKESEESSIFKDNRVSIGYSDHSSNFTEQPSKAKGGERIWCWGEILGHEHQNNYHSKKSSVFAADYCAKLYNKYGINFVSGLNSEFAGVIYDSKDNTVSLFTDRLGSRPIYYTSGKSGSLVFSSSLQSLGVFPGVNLKFDPNFLAEFLTYTRVFGTYTPAKDVYALPPASIVTFDLTGKEIKKNRYWYPDPEPRDLPFSDFVKQFREIFIKSVKERTDKSKKQGLLLSGGTDSRLLLEQLGETTTAFHMNEKLNKNKEAETAKKVAGVVGANFKFLRRGLDYYPKVLDLVGPTTSFNGLFRHAHAIGFAEEIVDHVNTIFTGHYADTILGNNYIMKEPVAPNFLRHLIPLLNPKNVNSIREIIDSIKDLDFYSASLPYLRGVGPVDKIMSENIKIKPNSIKNHGVDYLSWKSLAEFGMISPITNGGSFIFYETLNQIAPAKFPFLDNRIVDLALSMPVRYRLRRDIVAAALIEVNSDLASIEHPSFSPLYPDFPYYDRLKFYFSKASSLQKKLKRPILPRNKKNTLEDIDGGGSWPDFAVVNRVHHFIEEKLKRHKGEIESSEFLDYNSAWKCYQRHVEGEDFTDQLYGLLTVLESSISL